MCVCEALGWALGIQYHVYIMALCKKCRENQNGGGRCHSKQLRAVPQPCSHALPDSRGSVSPPTGRGAERRPDGRRSQAPPLRPRACAFPPRPSPPPPLASPARVVSAAAAVLEELGEDGGPRGSS